MDRRYHVMAMGARQSRLLDPDNTVIVSFKPRIVTAPAGPAAGDNHDGYLSMGFGYGNPGAQFSNRRCQKFPDDPPPTKPAGELSALIWRAQLNETGDRHSRMPPTGVGECRAGNEAAQAVPDEDDSRIAMGLIEQPIDLSRVILDRRDGAWIPDRHRRPTETRQPVFEALERLSRPIQTVKENDQGRLPTRAYIPCHRLATGHHFPGGGQAYRARSEHDAPIRGIKSSVVAGPDVPLDPRAAAYPNIGPELPPNHGRDT
jgi:hypothetical protein